MIFSKNRYKTTDFFGNILKEINREDLHTFLHDEDNIKKTMPQFEGEKVKEILKHILVISFSFNVFEKKYGCEEVVGYFDYKNQKYGLIKKGEIDE